MAFPTATTSAQDAASGESTINDLLSAGLDTTETEVQDVGDTPVSEPETEVEGEEGTEPEGDEATGEASEDDAESEDAEEESGDEEFGGDLETDFSDATYAKAAAHWDKRGVKLDPNDEGHRAMLKDWIERGQKIAELQSAQAEPGESEEESTTEQAAAPKAQPARTPEEQLQDRITGVRTYAKETYNPVVAKEIVMPMAQAFVNLFWGKDKGAKVLEGRTDADIAEFTQAISAAMTLQIADALPQIVGATPAAVIDRYPGLKTVLENQEKEELFGTMEDAVDGQGNLLYPGIGKLVENGAINRELAKLRDSTFSKDQKKDRLKKLEIAFQLAAGHRVDPNIVSKAVQRGRASERERQTRVAAGRTSPGNSSRGNSTTRSTLLTQLVGGGESRSAQLFKGVGRSKE
jgi:hypothetical protein